MVDSCAKRVRYHSDTGHAFIKMADDMVPDQDDPFSMVCKGPSSALMLLQEELLEQQKAVSQNAVAVFGDVEDDKCTWDLAKSRQSVFACRTCFEATGRRAGICAGCSMTCHRNHEVLELYTKRYPSSDRESCSSAA